MKEDRIKKLNEFLKENPDDPFLIYALALEFMKDNEQKAKLYLDQLLEQHPDYISTYYQAGELYMHMGKTNKAIRIYEKGIQKAKEQKNYHTLKELQEAYNHLLFEDEDD